MLDETLALLVDHLAETSTTVVVSTHQVRELEGIADHVGVMQKGRLVTQVTSDRLHRLLRRYRAVVPDEWNGAPGLNGAVLRQSTRGREIQWSIWGEEREVVERLAAAGAVVQDAASLSLQDAVFALLTHQELV